MMLRALLCAICTLMVTSTHVLADDDAARIGRVSKRKATNFVEEISAELADAKSKLGNVKGRVKATMETAVRHQTAARKHLDNDAYKRAYLTSMKAQKFVDLLTKAAATKIQMEQTAETMGTVTGTSDESSGEPTSKTAAVDAVAEAEARLAAAQAKAAAVGAAKAKPPVKPSPKPLPAPAGVLAIQLQIGPGIPVAAARSMDGALRSALKKLTPIAPVDTTNRALRDSGTTVSCRTDRCAEQLTNASKARYVLFSQVTNEDEIYTVKLYLYDKSMSQRVSTVEVQCELCAAAEVDKTVEAAVGKLKDAFKGQLKLKRKTCIQNCDAAFRARLNEGLTKETATYFLEKCLGECG